MLNIDKFNSKMNEAGGPVNSSKFIMRIAPKQSSWVDRAASDLVNDLVFFIDSVNLPGKFHSFSDIRRFGYGQLERRPNFQTFSEITCTVILDRKGNNLGFFNRWMDYILGSGGLMTETKNEMIGQNGGLTGYTHEHAYPDTYLTDIDIFVLDQHINYGDQVDPEKNCVVHYKLHDAYPSSIGDTDLNWNNNNTIARAPIIFQYKFWEATQHTLSTGQSSVVSSGTTNDSGLPNVGVDISIGPGGISGGVSVLGENGSVRVGSDGRVTGALRTGIGDINIEPNGRVSTQVNIPLSLTSENLLPVRKN